MHNPWLIVNFNGSVSVINSSMGQLEAIDQKKTYERMAMKQE